MKDNKKNFDRVRKIAKDFLLPEPYELHHDLRIDQCYKYCLFALRTESNPTHERLFQEIDYYFNCI